MLWIWMMHACQFCVVRPFDNRSRDTKWLILVRLETDSADATHEEHGREIASLHAKAAIVTKPMRRESQ